MTTMNANPINRVETLQARLVDYQKSGGSFKAIETDTRVSRTAISMLANHAVALPSEKLNKIEAYLNREAPLPIQTEASAEQVMQMGGCEVPADLAAYDAAVATSPTYKTSVSIYPTDDYKKIMGWCAYIYKHRKIGTMIGYPGSGKTTILREYARMNPAAHYVECWSSMTMSDLLEQIADAAGVTLKGRTFQREKQLMDALRDRTDFMLLLDEGEYLKKWNVEKFDALRKIWDNTGTPVILCGTPELINILTRGTGKDNCAQLYRRILKIRLTGIKDKEALDMLRDYNADDDAKEELVRCALDHKHGGIGNMSEILQIALETAEGGQIDRQMIEDAKAYKLMY
ncbi:MAG: ATP-binding protein [Eubacteriales bacterium]|nr:ATP-binding protein [Eubacteriales bacterium]